jgi:hypothetical protein
MKKCLEAILNFGFILNLFKLVWVNRGGLVIVAMRQLPRGSFFENTSHFKDIFREFEAFLKISFIFEYIFREIQAFFDYCEGFLKIAKLFKNIFSGIEAF